MVGCFHLKNMERTLFIQKVHSTMVFSFCTTFLPLFTSIFFCLCSYLSTQHLSGALLLNCYSLEMPVHNNSCFSQMASEKLESSENYTNKHNLVFYFNIT